MNGDTGQHYGEGNGGGYGMWTEAFTRLHHAATSRASAEEIRRLEAAEPDELHLLGGR
jgi:hypothetical protein